MARVPNPNWFPGNPNSQRPHTAPAGPCRSSTPTPPTQSLTETSSASSNSATETNNDDKKYDPPLTEWKKAGRPPEKALWIDSQGRAAAWRCRAVDARRPQVRGWVRHQGDWNPNNHRAWLDGEIVKTDPKWANYPPLPDLKAIAKEKRKREEEKEKKKIEEEKYIKLPWFMKIMGLKVVKETVAVVEDSRP